MPAAQAPTVRPPRPQFIALLKVLLPAIAAVILLAVVASAVSGMLRARDKRAAAAHPIELVAPRMIGADNKHRAFVITAASAEREGENNRIRLIRPVLVRDPGGEQQMRVTAKGGVYDQGAGRLELSGDVKLTGPAGDFSTPTAVYDAKTGEVLGRGAVQAAGPSGQMQAGSFAVKDKGASVVYKGGVRTRLNPK